MDAEIQQALKEWREWDIIQEKLCEMLQCQKKDLAAKIKKLQANIQRQEKKLEKSMEKKDGLQHGGSHPER